MAAYTLYGVALSIPAVKVGTALNMTGQSFDYKHVNLRGGEGKTPEYQAISRWGPTIRAPSPPATPPIPQERAAATLKTIPIT